MLFALCLIGLMAASYALDFAVAVLRRHRRPRVRP
jgi:hypothetical protein